MVTREDPSDTASRYDSSNSEFSAYRNEFYWAQDESSRFDIEVSNATARGTLREMFDNSPLIAQLEEEATQAVDRPSPYVR